MTAATRIPSHDPATLSMQVFGIYVMLTGLTLIASPNTLLGLFGIAPAAEIWIRVVGLLALIVGYYYWACGRAGALAFYRASIPGRLAFCAGCLLLVLLAGAPAQLLLFGIVDVAGAAWTGWALRRRTPAVT